MNLIGVFIIGLLLGAYLAVWIRWAIIECRKLACKRLVEEATQEVEDERLHEFMSEWQREGRKR